MENAAYPQGQCAEASAIGVLIAAGGRRVVEAPGRCGPARPGSPPRAAAVGSDSASSSPLDAPLHLAGPAGVIRTVTLGELLPLSLGPEFLLKEAPR